MKDLTELFNRGPIVVFQWKNEQNWPVEFATDNVEELTGYSREEWFSGAVSYGEIIHPEDLKRVEREVAENSNAPGRGFSHKPYRIITKNGSIRWVSDQTLVFRDGNGEIEGFIGYVSDITDQRKIERIFGFADRLKASIDGRDSPINIITTDFRIVGANRKLLDTFKLTEEEIRGRHCYEVYHQSSEPCEDCSPRILIETGESVAVEKILTAEDGSLSYIMTTAYPVFNESGKMSLIAEITSDITEKRKAEEKLREIAAEQQILLDALPAMVFWIDRDGRYVRVNKSFALAFKSSPEEIQGKSLFDCYPEEMAAKFHRDNMEVIQSGAARLNIEQTVETPGGVIWVKTDKLPLRDADGNVRGIIGLSMDITAQKRAEQVLRESEAQFRALFDDNLSVLFLIDPENGNIVDANKAACAYYGYPPEVLKAMKVHQINTLTETEISEEMKSAVLKKRNFFLFKHRLADGTIRDVEVYSGKVEHFGKSLLYSIVHDVTDRITAERQVLEERERLLATIRSIGDAVITTDNSGRVELMNGVAETLTGWSQAEAAGRPLAEVFCIINKDSRERVADPVASVLREKGIVGLANHTVLVSRQGAEYHIADSAAPIVLQGELRGVVLVFRDVTEKLKNEEDLFKAKKLESVGLLAGGIAHDFNNILTGLFGNIELVKMTIPKDHKASKYIENANRSLERATHLTRQLLTFAKGGEPVLEDMEIADTIRNVVSFNLSGSNVRAEIKLPENLWLLKADKGQIGQVFANLVINARQAMPTGGTLFIEGKNVGDIRDASLPHLAGDFVRITVRDEGVGISTRYLERIFDPYFTTKQTGSGLGLATVHSIIQKHNGHIGVESIPGEGTTFKIYLPAAKEAIPAGGEDASQGAAGDVWTPGRVLIMDDEEIVQGVVVAMLEALGYETETARDGKEAVRKYQEALSERPFSFALLDLTIPGGMGGKETAPKLLAIDPGAKMIVYSGYSDDPVIARFGEYGFRGRLVKPFKLEELKKAIQMLG